MSQDETAPAEERQAAPVEAQVSVGEAGETAAKGAGRAGMWAKLLLVAVVAAVLGAAANANWHAMPFSLIFTVVEIKAGVMIMCSAALGFILGVLFLWSALNRQ